MKAARHRTARKNRLAGANRENRCHADVLLSLANAPELTGAGRGTKANPDATTRHPVETVLVVNCMDVEISWADDCQGKKDYDADLVRLSSRYLAARRWGFTEFNNGRFVENEDRPEIK